MFEYTCYKAEKVAAKSASHIICSNVIRNIGEKYHYRLFEIEIFNSSFGEKAHLSVSTNSSKGNLK